MKILIVHDFISTNIFHDKDIKFIADIINKFNVDVTLATKENFLFERKVLCKYLKINDTREAIMKLDLYNIDNNSKKYIKKFIKGYDFIIGFELSKETKLFFDNLKIRYLDIWVSPIRFYKDVMFCFYSNDKQIQDFLIQNRFKDKKLRNYAKSLIKYNKYFSDIINLDDNSLLVIGQLMQDKSVLKDNKFLSLLDYKNEIINFSKQYSKIYFLKHPLMDSEEFQCIFQEFKHILNIEYIDNINTYNLLSKKEIKHVVGLSSSVLEEAKFFNKDVTYLYQPVLDESYVNIYKSFYKASFWKKILNIKSNIKFEYLVHDNYLRYSFDMYYSYKYYMNDFHKERLYKRYIWLYNSIDKLDKNKNYILYGYGTIGKFIFPLIKNNIKGIIDKGIDDDFICIDNLSIPKINIKDLTNNDNVIITPFLYNREIEEELSIAKCNIITFNI